jgi:hypothetical protein
MKYKSIFVIATIIAMACFIVNSQFRAEEPAKEPVKTEEKKEGESKEEKEGESKLEDKDTKELIKLAQDREELTMPGLKIMVKKGYVDVDAKICLAEGFLELIACTKDSKEHEALISVEPKAAHVHAALLLIGAQPGNPAMRKEVQTVEGPRWVDIQPRGQEIEVFLVFDNKEGKPEEHPINKFIMKGSQEYEDNIPVEVDKNVDRKFPTHTFLFTGSHVYKDGESDPIYLADQSGNVISLSTFGDELLALPGLHGHLNEALSWEIDPTHLPALNTKITLRLKPKKAAAAQEPKK